MKNLQKMVEECKGELAEDGVCFDKLNGYEWCPYQKIEPIPEDYRTIKICTYKENGL